MEPIIGGPPVSGYQQPPVSYQQPPSTRDGVCAGQQTSAMTSVTYRLVDTNNYRSLIDLAYIYVLVIIFLLAVSWLISARFLGIITWPVLFFGLVLTMIVVLGGWGAYYASSRGRDLGALERTLNEESAPCTPPASCNKS